MSDVSTRAPSTGGPARANEVTLAAVGDVALLRPAGADLFREGWDQADLRIANLEAPLTDGGVPAAKLIRLKAPVAAAEWLSDLRCDAVSLANNHIMDWGEPGLRSTLRALDAQGIQHAGAGRNLDEARRHRLLQVGGWTIALLSWAATVPPGFPARSDRAGLAALRVRTSYAADAMLVDEQPGTPPWVHTEVWAEDVQALKEALGRARAAADFVVLALHWGVPPQWASPFQGPLAEYQEALAPMLVEGGADLVLGHHAHTVYGLQAVERAGAGPGLVCFSLGNYVFHPLIGPRTLGLEAPSRPYSAPERPENRDTYVASFTLAPSRDGRLGLRDARLSPALLDEHWEARAPSPEQAARIAERVVGFTAWRGTRAAFDGRAVTWSAAE